MPADLGSMHSHDHVATVRKIFELELNDIRLELPALRLEQRNPSLV